MSMTRGLNYITRDPMVHSFATWKGLMRFLSRIWGKALRKTTKENVLAVFDIDSTLVYKTTRGYVHRSSVHSLYNFLEGRGVKMHAVTARPLKAKASTERMLLSLGLHPHVLYRTDLKRPSSENKAAARQLLCQMHGGGTRILVNVGDQFSDLLTEEGSKRVVRHLTNIDLSQEHTPSTVQHMLNIMFLDEPFVLLSGFDETTLFSIRVPSNSFTL